MALATQAREGLLPPRAGAGARARARARLRAPRTSRCGTHAVFRAPPGARGNAGPTFDCSDLAVALGRAFVTHPPSLVVPPCPPCRTHPARPLACACAHPLWLAVGPQASPDCCPFLPRWRAPNSYASSWAGNAAPRRGPPPLPQAGGRRGRLLASVGRPERQVLRGNRSRRPGEPTDPPAGHIFIRVFYSVFYKNKPYTIRANLKCPRPSGPSRHARRDDASSVFFFSGAVSPFPFPPCGGCGAMGRFADRAQQNPNPTDER